MVEERGIWSVPLGFPLEVQATCITFYADDNNNIREYCDGSTKLPFSRIKKHGVPAILGICFDKNAH